MEYLGDGLQTNTGNPTNREEECTEEQTDGE